jgi:type II secretory pathway component PulF
VGYKLLVRNPIYRIRADALKLRIPIAGPILRNNAIAQLSRNLALMLRSGLSMMVTLDLVRSAIGNKAIANALQGVRDSIERGAGMEEPLRAVPHLIPPLVTDMLVTGEDSGQLEVIADKVADNAEEEVNGRVDALGELLLPVLIGILAIPILGLAFALFEPIIQLMDGAGASSGV